MKGKKQYVVTMIAGLLLISLGVFFQLAGLANEIINQIFITAGAMMAVIGVIHFNKSGAGLTQDERTRQLGSRAVSYSWLITLVIVTIIFWADYLDIIKVTLSQGLGIILFTMVLSAGILQWILKRKGIINEDQD